MATVAEKFDNYLIHKFGHLFIFSMFVRMVDAQIKATGESSVLTTARKTIGEVFEKRITELETNLEYTVIPIQKLVRLQLGSALLAANHAAKR